MSFTNDDRTLVRAVRRTAARFPKRRYDSGRHGCEYKPDRANPLGCIMGCAFREDIGISIDDREGTIDEVLNELMETLATEPIYSWRVVVWAKAVQQAQDQRECWANAVRQADELVSEVAAEFPPIPESEWPSYQDEEASS